MTEKLRDNLIEEYAYKEFTYSNISIGEFKAGRVSLVEEIVYSDRLLVQFQKIVTQIPRGTEKKHEKRYLDKSIVDTAIERLALICKDAQSSDCLTLRNETGLTFDIDLGVIKKHQKVLVYPAFMRLPRQYENVKFHLDGKAGIVHIFATDDYFFVQRHFKSFYELVAYLDFRSDLIKTYKDAVNAIPESVMIGQFCLLNVGKYMRHYFNSVSPLNLTDSILPYSDI